MYELFDILFCNLAVATFNVGTKVVCSGPNFLLVFAAPKCAPIAVAAGGFVWMNTSLMTIQVIRSTEPLSSRTAFHTAVVRLSVSLLVLPTMSTLSSRNARPIRLDLLQLRVGFQGFLARVAFQFSRVRWHTTMKAGHLWLRVSWYPVC